MSRIATYLVMVIMSEYYSTILRASGTFIEVSPDTFLRLVNEYRDDGPLIVHGVIGVLHKKHVYVTCIRGLIFYCESNGLLPLRVDVEAKTVKVLKW